MYVKYFKVLSRKGHYVCGPSAVESVGLVIC